MRRAAAAAVGALVLLLAASSALADGVVLPSRAIVKPVRTPDQRALVAFDGTTETMVVETTLQGEGSEFAWIVPLPAVPKVEEAKSEMFRTLEVVTAPRVIGREKVAPMWTLPVFLATCVLGVWIATRRVPGWGLAGAGIPVAALFVLVATTFRCAHQGAELPPHALARTTIGAFDVATVDPGDGSGLRRWLDDNGFASPAAVDEVAADYARRGWVFVAAKLRTDESDAVRPVHPLAFTFAAKEPVYPMRLTLAANPSCALELYAFGEGTAEANGLSVEYSGPWYDLSRRGAQKDPEIARFAHDRPVTKLTGTLTPANCSDDLALRWAPYRGVQPKFLTVAAAADRANTAGAWTALLGAFLASIAVGSWRRGPSLLPVRRRVAVYGSVALAACLVCYVTWSTAPFLPKDAKRVYENGTEWSAPPSPGPR